MSQALVFADLPTLFKIDATQTPAQISNVIRKVATRRGFWIRKASRAMKRGLVGRLRMPHGLGFPHALHHIKANGEVNDTVAPPLPSII